jgi:hypothetical protein
MASKLKSFLAICLCSGGFEEVLATQMQPLQHSIETPMHLRTVLMTALLGSVLATASAEAATHQYRVFAEGVRAPLVPSEAAGNEGVASGSLVAQSSTDFGTVLTGRSASLVFQFTNTGTGAARDIRAVTGGSGLSLGSNTCGASGATVVVAAGQSCSVTVVYSPATAAPLVGNVVIGGTYTNSPASLSLTGMGAESANGVLTADTSSDFGTVTVGASTSRSFTFYNSGNGPANGVSASIPGTTGLTMTSNTCGTAAAPVTVGPNATCMITLAYGGSKSSRLSDVALSVAGTFTGAPASVALSGTVGDFSSNAAWSSYYQSVTALTPADLTFGTRTVDGYLTKNLYLINTGASGAMSVGYILTGDVNHFELGQPKQGSPTNSSACATGTGILATNRLSSTPCLTSDVKTSTYGVLLNLTYRPKSIGDHSITVTPISDNGTALPGAITLTGHGEFNPAGTWANAASSLTMSASDLNFGTKAPGTSISKTFYFRNTGTNGGLSAAFTMSGDISQFQFTRISTGTPTNSDSCITGGVIAANGTQLTECLGRDKALGGGAGYPDMFIQMKYAPTSVGNHRITLTPTSTNGSVMPQSVDFVGTAAFNPQSAWSTSSTSVSAPTASNLALGAKAIGTITNKIYYLHNTGQYGGQSVGFALSGDVGQFYISQIHKADGSGTAACTTGGVIAADKLSATPCQAEDINSGRYHEVRLIVVYAPTSAGSHSLTVTPTTNNGTVLPGAITLTGTGQ